MTSDEQLEVLGIAGVSHFVDPTTIAKRFGLDAAEIAELLLPEIETELDDAGMPRWMLRTGRRRELLARADRTSVQRWLAVAGAGDETDVEEVLRSWLRGELDLQRAARQSRDTVQRVASWLSDCRWLVPLAKDAVQTIEVESLRRHLKESAGSAFFGRAADRAWLTTALAAPERLAVIEAEGGMGKSALLARWLLDQGGLSDEQVVVLIDFDDPTLNVLNPDVLFAEVARQIALQEPSLASFHQALREQFSLAKARLGERRQVTDRGLDDSRSFSLIRAIFSGLSQHARRTILVFDTVERALRGPKSLVEQFVMQLLAIQSSNAVSLLIAGRGPLRIDAIRHAQKLTLQPLERDDAAELLRQRQVPRELVGEILARVPASPLTLRLAARAVSKLGFQVLDETELDWAISGARINGYLHARVLAHLPSPRLAAVARIALLLRTLTVEHLLAIVGPLAEPPIEDAEEARRMITELATVSDLVATLGQNGDRLEFRLEVFEEVTALLHAEDPVLSAQLHMRAREQLAKSSSPADQDAAEYHARALASLNGSTPGTVPTAALTLRELRVRVPQLLRAGRNAQALELVITEPSAQRDAGVLLLGARAAQRLAATPQVEMLARRALLAAEAPLHRAQSAMCLAWVADGRRELETARQERDRVRVELPQISADGASLIERAELLAGLAADRDGTALAELEVLFATQTACDALITADVDLVRQISALLRSPGVIASAADAKAFEYSGALDFSHLMRVLMLRPELLQSLSLPAEFSAGKAGLEALQRSQSLSSYISFIMTRLQHREDVHDVYAALADLLDQMRGATNTHAPAVLVDSTGRANDIENLVESLLSSHVDLRLILDGVQPGAFEVGSRSDKALLYSSLLKLDRMRLGAALVQQLELHGFTDLARQAAELFEVQFETQGSKTEMTSNGSE